MAYRADIEIGVKGTDRLRDLRNTIDDLSKRINKLDELADVFNAPIQSIRNYTQSLNTATSALQKVELGTSEETRAVKQYVQALGEANTARQRQLFLIDTEIRKRQGVIRSAATTGTIELGPGGAGFSGGFTAAQRQQANEQAILRIRQEENKIRRENLSIASREELFEMRLGRILEKNAALEQQRSKTREATSNAIIGGAFPLLFGQGFGASVGGGIGGFAGGKAGGQFGFGLSLVGTAVGSAFDQAVQSAKDFSLSLRETGDAAGYLEQQLGYIDPTLKKQIQNLQSSGQTAEAAKLAFNEFAKQVGTKNAAAFKQLGDDALVFQTGFQRLVTILIAGAARIDDAFKPIRGILQYGLNAVPGVNALSATRGAIDFVRGFGQNPGTNPSAETAASQQRTAELGKNNELLRLQLQLTGVSARTDLERYTTLQKQTAQKEYENELTKISIQLKNKEINLAQNEQLIRGANLKLSVQLGEIERNRIQELARRQEEAAQAAQQQLQARYALVKSIFDEQLKLVDISIRQQEFSGGAEAAARQSLRLSETRARLTEEALSAERDQALEEAKKNGTVEQTLRLYDLKLKAAERELDLLDAANARIIDRANLEKQLNAVRRQRDIVNAVTPVTQQQERTRLDIAGFTQPSDVIERERLLLDQRIRTAETVLPIEQQIADLNAEILSGTLDSNALKAKQADLAAQQQKLGLLSQELQVLDQLELKQLQIQQFTTKYGQLIQSISGEMANVVTNGLTELVRGTKTAEQVFADFLQSVGAALIQAAQQMIAQYIAIGIARIFAGFSGGLGGGGNAGTPAGGLSGSSLQGGFANPLVGQYSAPLMFANGGTVSAGSPYVVGEHGPELFVPGRNGSVVSNDNLRNAMGAAPGSGSPVLNMSFQTTSIGGVEYVSREQLEAAMAETRRQATRDGASRGMSMTLDRIKQSPQTRSRIGIR